LPRQFRRAVTDPSVPKVGCTRVQRHRSSGALCRPAEERCNEHVAETAGAYIPCLQRQRACILVASPLWTMPDR